MTKIPSTRLRFCLKTKHPTVGQTEGKISVVKRKLIHADRAKTHSLITPLMGGKLHEVLSKGGFPLLRKFYYYAWLSIHRLYFIYARKIYVRAHVKITQQWKSTLMQQPLQCFLQHERDFIFVSPYLESCKKYNLILLGGSFTAMKTLRDLVIYGVLHQQRVTQRVTQLVMQLVLQ